MRIALITAHDPLVPSEGCGQHAQPAVLARALAAHGHRVTVYARRQRSDCPRTTILGRGASIEQVTAGPTRPLPDDQAARHAPAFAGYLSDRWRARPPDVVHAFSWLGGLVALGAVRGTGIPVLQTFGSLAAAERRHGVGGDASGARLRMEGYIGRTADAVLAVSTAEAAELARLGVPKAAIRVIPVGIDTDLFNPDGERAERSSPGRLVAVAPAGQPHGLATVVRALTQLSDTELVIIGGPDARHLPRTGPWRDLCQLASTLRVRGRIMLAGALPADRLPPLLRSADLMVAAHRYEPTGIDAIQAMACGTPVVGPATGALGDAAIDGVTGLLTAPEHPAMLAHHVRVLMSKPVQLQALGIAAADRARSRYALDRIGRETAAAYEWCLRGQSVALAGAAAAAEEDAEAARYAEGAVLSEMAAIG